MSVPETLEEAVGAVASKDGVGRRALLLACAAGLSALGVALSSTTHAQPQSPPATGPEPTTASSLASSISALQPRFRLGEVIVELAATAALRAPDATQQSFSRGAGDEAEAELDALLQQ